MRNPTLFGAVYASRLIHEIDASSYGDFRNETRPKLDLHNPQHAQLLLKWLNSWNSRLKDAWFPDEELRQWQDEWLSKLPVRDLARLQSGDLDALVRAYEALVQIGHIGPTIASKIPFAACQHAAMMWDAPIREAFGGGGHDGYRGLLEQSQREAKALIDDADRCGVTVQEIVRAADAPTLAKVLDAYHWITITRGHVIPSPKEVQQWLKWIDRS